MTIFMKVYLTLLVISFFTMFGGIALIDVDKRWAAVCMFPCPILIIGGILYGILKAIWGV